MKAPQPAQVDVIQALQSAARRAGKIVSPGMPIGRIELFDLSGKPVLAVAVPFEEVAVEEVWAPAPSESVQVPPKPAAPPAAHAPPKPGWDFSTKPYPLYDGRQIEIAGRPLDLLKLLAEAERPLTIVEMEKAWDYPAAEGQTWLPPENGTCRWTLGDLRKKLKAAFPDFPGSHLDTVKNEGHHYWLTIR